MHVLDTCIRIKNLYRNKKFSTNLHKLNFLYDDFKKIIINTQFINLTG